MSLSQTERKTLPSSGSGAPAAACALPNAVGKSSAMPMTSPVDFISGPRRVSVPGEAVERQHGLLDADVLGHEPLGQGEVAQRLAEDHARGQLRELARRSPC